MRYLIYILLRALHGLPSRNCGVIIILIFTDEEKGGTKLKNAKWQS